MNESIQAVVVPLIYLASAVLFIVGLKRMTKVRTARAGNTMAAGAMLLAVVGTLVEMGTVDYRWILGGLALGSVVGAFAALRVAMTSMPEMVALLNGTGGLSSGLVALAVFWGTVVEGGASLGSVDAVTIMVSVLIGGLTLTGSLIAWAKLQGRLNNGNPILLPGRHVLNLLLALGAVAAIVWFAGFAEGQAALHGVRQVAVVATPDPLREEEVLAIVEAIPGHDRAALAEDIFEACAKHLAYYKVPGLLVFTDSMPTTTTQKIRKAALRDIAQAPSDQPGAVDWRSRKAGLRGGKS